MKIIPIILIFASCKTTSDISYSGGTCILTYTKNDTVWIASDTRLTEDNDGLISFDTICKTDQLNSFYFAFAGKLVAVADRKTGITILNCYDQMREIITAGYDNLDDVYTAFDSLISTKYNKIIPSIKSLKEGETVAQCLLLKYISGKPVFRLWRYNASLKTSKKTERYTDSQAPQPSLYAMGDFDYAFSYLNSNYLKLLNDSVNYVLYHAIKEESLKNNNRVSEPIDLIIIDNNGYRWVSKTLKKM